MQALGFVGGARIPADTAATWRQQPAEATLAAVVTGLPPIYSTFGFELHLGTPRPAIDLGIGVERAAAPALQEWCSRRAVGPPRHAPAWRALARFGAEWARRESPLAAVPFVFLEFDCASAPADTAPSLFVALDHAEGDRSAALHIAHRTLAGALRRGRRARAHAARERAAAALRSDARVLHLGLMLSRARRPVRLSVGLPARHLAAALRRLGLPAAAATALRGLVACGTSAEPAAIVQVDFDTTSIPATALGFTLQPPRPDDWAAWLAWLEHRGLCDAAQRAMLLDWRGAHDERVGPLAAPVSVQRYLSHIKLVWRSGAVLAKAYIGATPSPTLLRHPPPLATPFG
ncbi:MAG: hypothetical protein SF182_16995 [Deltaproteobacteria bacterium]|nr:hypothetical protein [Deltaproteobacteria bacterium]